MGSVATKTMFIYFSGAISFSFFFVQNVSFSWLHFNFQFLQILFKNFKNFSQSVEVNFIDPAKDFLVEEVKE